VPVVAQIVSRTGRPIPGVAATFHSLSPGASTEPALDTSDARVRFVALGVYAAVWLVTKVLVAQLRGEPPG